MWNLEDLARAAPSELADLADASMRRLAQSEDPAAFWLSACVDPPSGRVPRSGRAHTGPRELVVSSGKYRGYDQAGRVGALARRRVNEPRARQSSLQAMIKWPDRQLHPLLANAATRQDLRLRAAGRPTRHFPFRILRIASGTGLPQRVVRRRFPDQPRTRQYRSTADRGSSG